MFKVQSSRFKVRSKGRHDLFMLYGWAKGHVKTDRKNAFQREPAQTAGAAS